MPWPGAPKSQQSPTINPPSVRYTYPLGEDATMGDVTEALRVAFNGLTNHEQAFANLPSQIATQATAAATAAVENIENETTAGVTSFNSAVGAILYFPGMGAVSNEIGSAAYTIQQSDAGSKIICGDSSPVTVTLNGAITPPWFAFIGNDSTSNVSLSPSGASLVGINSVYPGGTAIVFYDGTTFWCEGVAIATDSSLGVVEPDGVTIGVNGGEIFTQITVANGAPGYTPVTPGNPFYFDSTASPWHGYVWYSNRWNRFS